MVAISKPILNQMLPVLILGFAFVKCLPELACLLFFFKWGFIFTGHLESEGEMVMFFRENCMFSLSTLHMLKFRYLEVFSRQGFYCLLV